MSNKPQSNTGRAWWGDVTVWLVTVAVIMTTLATMKALRGVAVRHDTPAVERPLASAGAALFTDITAAAGIDLVHDNGPAGRFWIPQEMGPGAALFDCDGDGDLDLFVAAGGDPSGAVADRRSRLFRNDGTGHFADVSAATGADVPGVGMGTAAADMDHDGDVDLYVARVGNDVLLLNDGAGVFRDATVAAGIDSPDFGASVCVFDYDRDGLPDIYVANYVVWSPEREKPCYDAAGARDYCSPTEYDAPAPDRLFRNLGGGRFEDVSNAAGITGVAGNSLGLVCTDLDADGWDDVYVASDQTPALLWMNQGDGTFREEAALRGCAFSEDGMAIAGMGTVGEDIDGDGDVDLLVTNLHDMIHLALRNDGGVFEDVSHAWGLGGWAVPFTGFGVAAFDQDHDGDFDVVVGNGAVLRLGVAWFPGYDYAEPDQFVRWTAEGRFEDATAAGGAGLKQPGTTRAVVKGDLDNDGDIDVVMTNNGGALRILRNDNATAAAWVTLHLVPESGAHDALGARAELEAGGRTWVRTVRPHTGYLSTHDARVHYGLGAATAVERLVVTWPSGRREQWTAVPVNRIERITEGSGRAVEVP